MVLRVMVLAVLIPMQALAIGVDEKQLDDPAMEARAREIMKDLRCLVCQNQSIEDSNADLARDLRVIVRERVAAGDSREEVKTYMVARYGEWVLLKPPFSVRTWALWLGPLVLLLVGGLIAWRYVRRPMQTGGAAPLSPEEEARINEILARDGIEPDQGTDSKDDSKEETK
jgi:cytochrome c-type biogenesis protein CcmH